MYSYESLYYRKYIRKGDLDKALHTLEGILKGIAIDEKINRIEISELTNWCNDFRPIINMHPFNELIPLIDNVVKDNIIEQNEYDDILWLCNIFKTKNVMYDLITSDLQRLEGILHGILSDNVITEEEIRGLSQWINQNSHLEGCYPFDEIHSLVVSVLSDGTLSNDEKQYLKLFFSEFIDLNHSINIDKAELDELRKGISINGICTVCPDIIFEDHIFCFTGVSAKTTRIEISKIIESHGGKYHDKVIQNTNYLVVGGNGNPCWAYSCYGRKVEDAVKLRKKGHKILIIHENDFWDAVEDL